MTAHTPRSRCAGSIPGPDSADTGAPFVPPPCTAEAPPSPALLCVLPVDKALVADCLAGGHAALLAGTGFPTVQAAIDVAVAGDIVDVCPGHWTEEVTVAAEIVLEAADPTPDATLIDGGLRLLATSTVRGLTVTGGGATGGVSVDAADVVLECLTVQDNEGSGILASQGGLVIRESLIRRNTASDGGGLASSAGVVVEDTTFEDNYAGYSGGGAVSAGDATFTRTAFLHNVADYSGGGLEWGESDPHKLQVIDSLFHCNASGYEGGGMSVGSWGDDDVVISGTTFSHDFADNDGGGLNFGSWGSVTLTMSDSTVASCRGRTGSGGLQLGGWMDNGVFVTLTDVAFTDSVGQALAVGSRVPVATITGTGVSFLRNGPEGAIDLTATATFDCTGCDAGAGADDNVPHDATKAGVVTASLPPDFSL